MLFNQSNITSIVEASQGNNLVVFIGAGFSKFSQSDTADFPSWFELIEELKEELETNENDFLKVAQLYELTFGKYRLYQRVKKSIPFHALPSEFHREIFKLNPKYVLTTNWDDLLEKTVNENNLNYDIVKSDIDLVKSAGLKKLVKIHGSLDSHNIVFTEDDYLNYSLNSPLIENFLRHILSTMTVLFLGYSFSDNDLKMITKWIEKQSNISPPRYLLHNTKDEAYSKYLLNHGINVISPKKITSFPDLYDNFFKQLHTDPIVNKISSEGKDVTELDAIDFFYKKLKVLSEFNSLLPEQITDIFSNCTIEYHEDIFGLWFHKDTMTMDYDKDIRNIYKLFFNVVSSPEKLDKLYKFNNINHKINYIANVFLSANVIFIRYDKHINITTILKEENISEKNQKIIGDFEKFIRFDSKMNSDLFLPIKIALEGDDKKEENLAYRKDSIYQMILENKRNQDHARAMINKFNHNVIVDKLILTMSFDKGKYIEERIDLEEDYLKSSFLINTKEKLNTLVKALNFYWVYQSYFDASNDHEKFSNLALNIKNGGFGFDNKKMRSNDRYIQLLKFYSTNNILIDDYIEFKSLMRLYVTSKIEIQSIEDKYLLKVQDFFIMIKYFEFDGILKLIHTNILIKFKEIEKEDMGREIFLITEYEKNYLLESLSNLSEYIQQAKISAYENVITKSFVNIVVTISLIDWDEKEWGLIVRTIIEALNKIHLPHRCLRAIDNLILINYKLYKKDIPELLNFFDIILLKIYHRKLSFINSKDVDFDFKNIYQYGSIIESKYSNTGLVEKVVDTFKIDFKKNKELQRQQSKSILLPIMPISSKNVKQLIKKYINGIRIKKWDDDFFGKYQEIIFELDFIQYGFSNRENFTSFLNRWIDSYFCEDVFTDIEFLKVGGVEQFLEYFSFLGKSKGICNFNVLHDSLNKKYKHILREREVSSD